MVYGYEGSILFNEIICLWLIWQLMAQVLLPRFPQIGLYSTFTHLLVHVCCPLHSYIGPYLLLLTFLPLIIISFNFLTNCSTKAISFYCINIFWKQKNQIVVNSQLNRPTSRHHEWCRPNFPHCMYSITSRMGCITHIIFSLVFENLN